MKRQIKCCVYRFDRNHDADLAGCSVEYQAFYNNAFKNGRSFYDSGDDPSFYCASKHDNNVTWGVCRHNVRQALKAGDEIHFVACDQTETKKWSYHYIGFGLIEECIRHPDIFLDPSRAKLRTYFNLLIRPRGRRFEHFEPIPRSSWHESWKKRISEFTRYEQLDDIIEKRSCSSATPRSNGVDESIETVGLDFPFGENYIIFDKKRSRFNTVDPLHVCDVYWKERYKPRHLWTSKRVENLFCRDGQTAKHFTSGNHMNPAFNLDQDRAQSLKEYA